MQSQILLNRPLQKTAAGTVLPTSVFKPSTVVPDGAATSPHTGNYIVQWTGLETRLLAATTPRALLLLLFGY